MLKSGRALLYDEFNRNVKKVPAESIYRSFCDEKLKHSQQVLGAANYIMKHEPYFSQQPASFIETAQTVALLHDIARFAEAVHKFQSPDMPYNHSVKGAEYLALIPEFNIPQIVLPVRYHGDIYLSRLYDDADFVKLSSGEKLQVEKIAQLVRDADKTANMHLFFYHQEHLKKLVLSEFFSSQMKDKAQDVRPEILQEILREHLLVSSELVNQSERVLQILAWFFDLNYKTSFVFCQKRNVLEKMFSFFCEICPYPETQEIVLSKIQNFVDCKLK